MSDQPQSKTDSQPQETDPRLEQLWLAHLASMAPGEDLRLVNRRKRTRV